MGVEGAKKYILRNRFAHPEFTGPDRPKKLIEEDNTLGVCEMLGCVIIVNSLSYTYIDIYIRWYLIGYLLKKRERTALSKSAHQLCSRLLCAGLSLCHVHMCVSVMFSS